MKWKQISKSDQFKSKKKKMNTRLVLALSVHFAILANGEVYFEVIDTKYEPEWDSLDSRPLPQWYDEAKFGIFIHWGVFSVPSFGSEWFWSNWQISNDSKYSEFMNRNYHPNFTYQEFAKGFTAEFFDPEKWAELFVSSGARYVVLTSKHHEGYTLWPSKNSFSWNAKDVGPKRDLVGELAAAVKAKGLTFGVYHSLYEWFNPLYLYDKRNKFATGEFVRTKTMPELYDLVTTYNPEIIWSDGDWEASDSYWNSKAFLAWLYNESPVRETVVTNDRWGEGTLCKHGGFFTCSDRFSPDEVQPFKFENCLSIDRYSWGFRRNADLSQYMTIEELIREIVKTVSCGGNILINVGPTKDGVITPIYEERLLQIGNWLKINGEAIYNTKPWTFQKDTLTKDVWYTRNGNHVYSCFLSWPESDTLTLGSLRLQPHSKVKLLGYDGGNLPWEGENAELRIHLPKINSVQSKWAYVLKFSDVRN